MNMNEVTKAMPTETLSTPINNMYNALESVPEIHRRLHNLYNQLRGEDTPPTPHIEVGSMRCYADLMGTGPDILRNEVDKIHEVISSLEDMLQ